MNNFLPRILACGTFNSEKYFADLKISPERLVKSFEIELFKKDGGCSVINGQENNIRKGGLLIAKPDDLRYSHLHFSCKFVHFEVKDDETCRLLSMLPSFINMDLYADLSHYFDKIFTHFLANKEFSAVYGACAIYELICKIADINYTSYVATFSKNSINAIYFSMEFMKENYMNHITTRDVAKASGLSVSYFHKKFLEIVGITPIAHLTNIRIEEAKKYLLSGDTILDIIAEKCGFASTTYFTTCFKKTTGFSPAKFRKTAKYPIFEK